MLVQIPLAHIFSVHYLTVVEGVGGELADQGVHPVLNGQHSLLIAAQEESFEEAAREMGLDGIITVGRGWQLVLITDENDALRIEVEWDETRRFDCLASFVHDEIVDLATSYLQSFNSSHRESRTDNRRLHNK